jgi:hypothetical protein
VISSPALIGIAALLAVAGLAAVNYFLLTGAIDLIAGLVRKFRRALRPNAAFYEDLLGSLNRERSSKFAENAPSPLRMALRIGLQYPLPLLAGLLMAMLAADGLLSPVMLLIGLTAAAILYFRAQRAQWNRLTDDAELLVVQFAARFSIHHSVSAALEESMPYLARSALATPIQEIIRRVRLGQSFNQAVTPFERIPHPILQRMARVLAKSGTGDPTVYAELLAMLRDDTQAARDLQNRTRAELGVISSTVLVLQSILAASLIAMAFVPLWREYFTASAANRLLYGMMAILGAVGSLYVERRYGMLEEQA